MTDHPLPDPASLEPIEGEFWTEDGLVPPEATIAVRGAPITGEKFLAHALRQAREYSLRGTGAPPHADVVLPVLGIVEAERLAGLFAPNEEANPHKDRRR